MGSNNIERYKASQLRNVQLKQLAILKQIDGICKKHSIEYWLDGGTLLGAVRHGGFIPWDDDIDIAMKASDVERFEKAAKEELPEWLFLQNRHTDPFCKEDITKVRDLNSLYIEYSDTFYEPYERGIYVDIFPMVPYPSISRGFVKKVCRGYSVANSILAKPQRITFRSLSEFLYFSIKKRILGIAWKIVCAIRPKDTFFSNIIKQNGYGIMHLTKDIFPISTISFEDTTFCAPCNPDGYLSDLYGNYMQLPPEEKRKGHAIFYVPEL